MNEGPNEPRIFMLEHPLASLNQSLVYVDYNSDEPLESRLTKLREQYPGRRFFVVDELVRP